ncbi:M16 family metallopeptidase [Isoptericola sp. NPDC019693]|uniref:M16 family metallopeptidase n=1 Tax=Isoptericola sp. NPDC019693 TaxID=3364009 RepID=UPI0037BA74C9
MDPDARAETTSTHRTAVDGVPVLWADLMTDPTTTLTFGVGLRDLRPGTAGITHLVEHLVMRRVGRVRYSVNAESSLGSTSFYVTGTPAQTTEFLGRVCDAVRDLATSGLGDADLEAERRTVLAEIGQDGLYGAPDPLSHRYGPRGPGTAVASHARLLDWREGEVLDVVRRWFHAGNAVLTSTRPVPADLRLDLPAARPVERQADPDPVLSGRAWTFHPAELNLSGVVGSHHGRAAVELARSVLSDALTESTRTATGDVYAVEVGAVALASGTLVLVDLDPQPDRTGTVATTAVATLDRLADAGPTAGLLDDARETLASELSLGAVQASLLDTVAAYELRGIRLLDAAELSASLGAVTADQVRDVLAEVAASLLVSVPGSVSVGARTERALADAGIRPERQHGSETPTGTGRVFRGRLFGPARGMSVVVYKDAIVLRGDGPDQVVRAHDVVLAGTDGDGDLELVSASGCAHLVAPSLFRGLTRPLAEWVRRLPESVRYVKSRPDPADV